jgi:hypothetical protein
MTDPMSPPPIDDSSGEAAKAPAIALIVYNSILVCLGLMAVLFSSAMHAFWDEVAKEDPKMRQVAEIYKSGWFTMLAAVEVVLAIVAIVGAVRMLQRRTYVLAVVATILTMVNPAASCCCVIGIGLGIWALVVLMRDEVQRAFNRP